MDSVTKFKKPKELKNVVIRHLEWSSLMPEIFLTVYMNKGEIQNYDSYDNNLFLWNKEFP